MRIYIIVENSSSDAAGRHDPNPADEELRRRESSKVEVSDEGRRGEHYIIHPA